jgi:hypothetical protein
MPGLYAPDVVETRTQVDRWLASVVPACDPFAGTSVAELSFRRKCLNELAIYLLWTEHLGVAATPESDRLRAAFADFASDDYLDLACRSPKRVLMFSAALSYALRAGLLDATRRRRVSALLCNAFAWSTEWPAFRQLDLLTACAFGGLRGPLSARDVVAASSLAVPPCPIYSDRDGYYALCHSVVYAFILGAAPEPSRLLVEALDGGLCRAVATEDLDLGLELVLSCMVLGLEATPAMTLVVERALAQLNAPPGALSSPSIKLAAIEDFSAVRPLERPFAESFHLMLVAGLVLAFAQARGIALDRSCDEADARFVRAAGAAFAALHRYSLPAGLSLLADTAPRTALEFAHVGRIADFVSLNAADGGRYGLFVEERAIFRSLHPERDFEASVQPHVDTACTQFLARHAVAGGAQS